MNNQQPIFNITLNLDQVNVILSTMGKLPYESIAPLMNSIQNQASRQMEEFQAQQAASQSNQDQSSVSENIIQ